MRSIQTTISLWYFLSFTVLFLVFLVAAFYLFRHVIYNHFDSRLQSLSEEFSDFFERNDPEDNPLIALAGKEKIVLEVYQKKRLYLSFQVRPGYFSEWAAKETSGVEMPDGFFSTDTLRAFIKRIPLSDLVIIVGIDRRYYFGDVPILIFGILCVIILCILSIYLIGRAISKRLLYPLEVIGEELLDTVNQNIEGKRIAVPVTGKEISNLVFAINLSLGKLEKYLKEIKGFSDYLAHELRTPLTLVKMTLQNLKTSEYRTSSLKSIEEADQEVEEAVQFLNDLLLLSNLEKGIIERFQDFDLGEVLLQNFEKASKLYPKKRLDVDISALLLYRGAAQLISHAVYILLENACKYSEEDLVTIRLFQSVRPLSDDAPVNVIQIDSIGRRVQWDELKKIPIQKGHGIGLNLCRRIAQVHNGTLSYSFQETHGEERVKNTFELKLP